MHPRARLVAVFTMGALGVVAAQGSPPSPSASAVFAGKLDGIRARGVEEASADPAPTFARRTVIDEGELNAWLALEASPRLAPSGIADAAVSLLPGNRVTSVATVDLETLRGPVEPNVFDPLSLLRGRVPVALTGQVASDAGEARFLVERAFVGGVPVPPTVLKQLVTRYSRSPERPDGFRLDEPFPLPAGIDRIVVGQGRAVVVQ
jgi:hypothetical protein